MSSSSSSLADFFFCSFLFLFLFLFSFLIYLFLLAFLLCVGSLFPRFLFSSLFRPWFPLSLSLTLTLARSCSGFFSLCKKKKTLSLSLVSKKKYTYNKKVKLFSGIFIYHESTVYQDDEKGKIVIYSVVFIFRQQQNEYNGMHRYFLIFICLIHSTSGWSVICERD